MQDPDTDLEDLLAESQADDSPDDSDPLDELLAESLAAAREQLEAKAARERAKRGGQSASEATEDAERIRRWELAHEWKAVANVALFERHTCACGRHQTIFRQLMTRQQHRHLRDSQRWQRADASLADLPNEVVVQKWETPMCPACAPQAGFEFRNVTEWIA